MVRVPANEGTGVKTNTFGFLCLSGLIIVFQPVFAANTMEAECSPAQETPDRSLERGHESEKDLFEHSYAEAECLRKMAAGAGAEWLKTEVLLKRSGAEAGEGSWDIAIKLVQKARFEAETALQQADFEATAWKHRVIQAKETKK